MVEIIAPPDAFRTSSVEIEPPRTKVSRLPTPPRGIAAEPRQIPTGGVVKFEEIGLDEEYLKKLEKFAKEVGLEVPEKLKRKYRVRSEGAEAVKEMLRSELNNFLDKLKKKYEEKLSNEKKSSQVTPSSQSSVEQSSSGDAVDSEAQQILSYEIGLSQEDITKLESAAKKVGLQVPENLKQHRVVSAEEKDEALAEFQKELDEFLEELRTAYAKQSYERDMMRLRGMAEAYKEKHPGSRVFINDAGFMVVIDPVSAAPPSSDNSELNLDVDVSEKPISTPEPSESDNPYRGYEEYYKGLYALRKALDLETNSTLNLEPVPRPPNYLLTDQTATWEDIQRTNKAMHEIWTLGGFLSDKLGLSPDKSPSGRTVKVYESELSALDVLGSPATSIGADLDSEEDKVFAEADLEKPVEEFLKGVGRGAIGVFTFPADIALFAMQADKLKYLAAEENKSVGEFLKDQAIDALHDPGFYGELFGSLLTSAGLSSLKNAMKPKVYVEKGGVQGVRTTIEKLNLDGDELARAVRTELFDLDKTTTITVQKKYKLFGPKVINVDTTYDSFKAISSEGIKTSSGNVMGRTRILEFSNLDDGLNVGKFTVRELAKMGDDSARLFSEAQKDIVASTDDILSFVDEATSSGKSGPTKIVRTTDYITDEGLKIKTLQEFYDDIVKTEQKITSFAKPRPVTGSKKGSSFSTLDDLVNKAACDLDEVIKSVDTRNPIGSGGVTVLEEDPLKGLTDLGFKVREKPTTRTEVTPKSSPVAGFKVPDLSTEVENILNPNLSVGDFEQDQNTGSTKRSRRRGGSKTISHPDIRVLSLGELEESVFGINTSPRVRISSKTSSGQRDYRIPTQVVTPKEFHIDEPKWDIRDITDPLEDIDRETRAILSQVLDTRLTTKTNPKKPKYKTKKKKKRPIQTAPKKKKSQKKRTKGKGGEWGIWIGYESLLDW
uniref:Tn2-2p n=1 Tax=Thermococcus nautili TaxID=195522 RepID=D6MXZ6_9EURY|nr:hypothetical protein [Thermococcus nautili]ADF80197.1 tn2-2p [Thermococcus nautili]